MNQIAITSEGRFSLGGENFLIAPPKDHSFDRGGLYDCEKRAVSSGLWKTLRWTFTKIYPRTWDFSGRQLRVSGQAVQASPNVCSRDSFNTGRAAFGLCSRTENRFVHFGSRSAIVTC